MRFLLLIILWVLTPQGLQIGEVFYNNQRIKIMKLNLNNPAFLQSASNVSGEIVPIGNPYYIKGREDNTTVIFKHPEYTQVSSDGVSYADASESMIINSGEKIYLKCTTITTPVEITGDINVFDIDKPFDAGGLMEPVKIDFSYGGTSYSYTIFAIEALPIVDAKKLIIDISDFTNAVCSFRDCTSLVNAPKLPATTLAEGCYRHMFQGCTSLVNAPELPATTLADGCYSNMFIGCTNLVNAPELPVTTLAEGCYTHMFQGCTNLVNAPELPATTLADGCYSNMFIDCTSLVNAPKLPATTLAEGCYRHMFQGCTSLVNAPELPATTLAEHCYSNMFSECQLLKRVLCLATDISAPSCTYLWLYNVSDSGVFIKAPGVEWPTGDSGIPEGWTVEEYAG